MSKSSESLAESLLLGRLAVGERERLLPHLQPVSPSVGEVLFRPDELLSHVYFPRAAIVSLLTGLTDGNGMEVGLVGKEGFVGISAILGGTETKVATVQASGTAWKLDAEILRAEFRRQAQLYEALLRYTHALMTQISQTVVCNALHPLEGRLARWLLMYHDRLGRDEFEMTQQFMSQMLGVRRPGLSEVAAKLQDLGLIKYKRGQIKIVDRQGLEKFACECYGVIKERFADLMM